MMKHVDINMVYSCTLLFLLLCFRGKVSENLNRSRNNKRYRLALLLGFLTAFGPLTIDMYLPSFPSIASEFSTNASLVQFSLTACLLGLGIGQLVIGPMSDVRGRRSPLLIFLTMYIVASILSAFAPTISIFIGARFLRSGEHTSELQSRRHLVCR